MKIFKIITFAVLALTLYNLPIEAMSEKALEKWKKSEQAKREAQALVQEPTRTFSDSSGVPHPSVFAQILSSASRPTPSLPAAPSPAPLVAATMIINLPPAKDDSSAQTQRAHYLPEEINEIRSNIAQWIKKSEPTTKKKVRFALPGSSNTEARPNKLSQSELEAMNKALEQNIDFDRREEQEDLGTDPITAYCEIYSPGRQITSEEDRIAIDKKEKERVAQELERIRRNEGGQSSSMFLK